jgi:hypothetical protein
MLLGRSTPVPKALMASSRLGDPRICGFAVAKFLEDTKRAGP